MIENDLFSKILQPLLKKKSEIDAVSNILRSYIKNDFTVKINRSNITMQSISTIQKKEIFLHKDEIEQKLEEILGKKYIISF